MKLTVQACRVLSGSQPASNGSHNVVLAQGKAQRRYRHPEFSRSIKALKDDFQKSLSLIRKLF